jgi:coenzyme PQQ synthesis protein D (PqqD)
MPSEAVAVASPDDQAMILLQMESGIYYGLSDVGTRIWQLLGEGIDESELIARLLEEYDVPTDRLRADVARLLAELEAKKLVRSV